MSGKERLLSILMSHLCADHNTYLLASIFLISPLAGASRTHHPHPSPKTPLTLKALYPDSPGAVLPSLLPSWPRDILAGEVDVVKGRWRR